jgi:hypothetical protein
MDTKTLHGLKVSSKGEIEAVFATLGVVDHDGDVTKPGAFGKQNVRISAYNHGSWSGALPVGKGTISEVGNEAILNGKFFMSTTHGRDTFETVKESGDLMEWSYGYDILAASPGQQDGRDVQFLEELNVIEVSPVILGAGIDTRTLSAKSANGKLTPEMAEKAGKLVMKATALRLEAERCDQYEHLVDLVNYPQRAAREQLERNLS